MSAPFLISYSQMNSYPLYAASCNGVFNYLSLANTLNPYSSKYSTSVLCPSLAATCNGDRHYSSTAVLASSMSPHARRKSLVFARSPFFTNPKRGTNSSLRFEVIHCISKWTFLKRSSALTSYLLPQSTPVYLRKVSLNSGTAIAIARSSSLSPSNPTF